MSSEIEDLHAAIDRLIVRKRVRLFRDGGTSEMHTLPSLWEQLEGAVGYSSSAGSGSGGFTAQSPISTEVVALIIEISETVAEAVMAHAGQSRQNVPLNLRLLASKLADWDEEDDLLDDWVKRVRKWNGEAETALRLNPQRPRWARGVRCPDCGAETVSAKQDGETVRRPALCIQWSGPDGHDYHADDEWKVRAVTCDQCGQAWWRGPDLDALVNQMLTANTTKETMLG